MFESFGFSSNELISLSGGGGKTSLLFALSCFFLPHPSIMTTTTKIAIPANGGIPLFLGEMVSCERARSLSPSPTQAIYAQSEKNGKLIGFSAEEVDDFYRAKKRGRILVEADGAKGFPFKAHKESEPVIPQLSTRLIVLVGAEIFLQKPDDRIIFRLSELRQRWDFDKDRKMSLPLIAKILEDSEGYLRHAPDTARCRRTLFINKSDLLDPSHILEIAEELEIYLTQYHDFCIGSLLNGCLSFHRNIRGFLP